ncbi:MAG: hypothetical protein FJ135_11520 [Deltaproteobacteria bacterium]|nr:hypothetical protein [Deltaproteobacteria bacterium]
MQLVINTPGSFLTQKDACFRLKLQDRVMDVSPLKVETIVITNQAMISSQAVVLALEHNIDIIFLDGYGDPVGRIWFSKMGSTALIRRRQLEAFAHPLGLSLVFDLIEPFRLYAEQTAVYLFTGKKIKDAYFDVQDHAVSLNQQGKPVVVDAFQQHLDEAVRYRRRNVKRRYIMQHEAHRLANILLADTGEARPEWLEIKEL